MRVLIATDAWHPQVNGVVRTLTSLAASAPAWRRRRISDAGRLSVGCASDLSESASRVAEQARDRAPIEGRKPGRHPYRDRRADRLYGARLLPPARLAIHVPAIRRAFRNTSRRAFRSLSPGATRCCGASIPPRT